LDSDQLLVLHQVLMLKVQLQKQLQAQVTVPVTVGIELVEGKWAFAVRGPDPGFASWNGYAVLWYRSHSVGQQ